MELPEQYIVQKIYQTCKNVSYNKFNNVYNMSCPICNEGKSKGRKKRLYYFPKDKYFFCHNCQKSWNPVNWIIDACKMSFNEIAEEVKNFDSSVWVRKDKKTEQVKNVIVSTLPEDSINLFDKTQVDYFLSEKVVKDAMDIVVQRRLNKAINKPDALYISLKDYVHKNRICIPFYDTNNKIVFYQSRSIYKEDESYKPKYLGKFNSEKTLFGINNIDEEFDYIFIFEGPIDSFFVKNGVAIGGIKITEKQQEQIDKFKFHKKIWVLDNDLDNPDVMARAKYLAETGESMFLWPDKFKKFKDVNEVCQKCNLDQISPDFFIKNTYSGMDLLRKL